MTGKRIGGLLLLLLAMTLRVVAGPAVPQLKEHVTDLAGILTAEERGLLESELSLYEDSTSNQFVLLIIPSLQGEALESYSLQVAEANKLGQKGKDNGLLLLIAVDDRKIRVETGYGLEGAIPDAISAGIIANVITPRFRQSDYFGGIEDGFHALMQAAAGEYKAEPKDNSSGGIGIAAVVIVIIIFVIIRAAIRRGKGGGPGGPRIGGGILPWLIASQIFNSRNRGGGWGSGGFGGGFGGGGGGGWGGGGGGSFGGGGASGGW